MSLKTASALFLLSLALSLGVACASPAAAPTLPSTPLAAPAPKPAATADPAPASTPAPSTPVALEQAAGTPPTPTLTPLEIQAPTPAPTVRPALAPAPTPALQPALPPSPQLGLGEVLLEVAQATEASYRVREQLASLNLPSDAVGRTKAVEGSMVLGADNRVQAERSKIVVDLRTLRSDERLRDSFIQRETLQTGRFPYAEFVLREVRGLASPLPQAGEAQFQCIGDLTLRGVTRTVTWEVSARFSPGEIVGRATTSFRFGDYDMAIPRVAAVLSVEDNIRLSIDFVLKRTG